VELLTVIAILTLLIAILLPALTNARRAANEARCVNNLRQITIALLLYVQDSHDWMINAEWGRYPSHSSIPLPDDYPSYWDGYPSDTAFLGKYTDPEYGQAINVAQNFNSIQIWGLTKNISSVWVCPEAYDHDSAELSGGGSLTVNYALDMAAYPTVGVNGPLPSGPTNQWKLSQVHSPSLMLAFVDSCMQNFDPGYTNPPQLYGNTDWGQGELPPYTEGNPESDYNHAIRHPGNVTNASFLDGHVIALKNTRYGGVLSLHQACLNGDFVLTIEQ
jgi:prepilin-type processing-associated H-X9-DG protein